MILITDRTEADVRNDTAKGNYNITDLNRVGNAVSAIAELFRDVGYTIAVNPKVDWTEDDYPSASLMTAYLADVAALCALYTSIPSHNTLRPLPANMRSLTVDAANNIEKNLLTINDLASNLARSFDCCNEIYTGE